MQKIQYNQSLATRHMHALPRFGHPSEFALIFGSREQRSDYIYGLLFAGVFIYAWFIMWYILLPIFICLGRRKVGFLSGNPMRVSEESKKPLIIRIVFILSAAILVTFSALLVTEGLTQLKNGVTTVYDSSVEVNRLLGQVDDFATALNDVIDTAQPLRDELVSRLANESFCPGVDLIAQTGINFNFLINESVTQLEELGNFAAKPIAETQYIVDKAQQTIDNVQSTADNITPSDWQSLMFVVPFSIFAVLFVLGVALAWCDRVVPWYTCMLTWIILPLFIILIVLCFLLSGGIAIVASANADFCSGGTENTPEGSIKNILKINGYSIEDLAFQVVTFYIGQCQSGNNPLGFLTDVENSLIQANETVVEFEMAFQNVTVQSLTVICGGRDFQSLQILLEVVIERLISLVAAAAGVLSILTCETLVPLYTSTLYNGTCEYSVQGITWTFAAFLVLAISGMVMITFRTAYYRTQDADMEKLDNAPMEYSEALEVEYDPSRALSLQDNNTEESYGLQQTNGDGANVATGVVVGS